MQKKKDFNEEALNRIKDIYHNYIESDDCERIGNLVEVVVADAQLYTLIKREIPHDRFSEVEDVVTDYANCTEMQGFVYGFACAMRLMSQGL